MPGGKSDFSRVETVRFRLPQRLAELQQVAIGRHRDAEPQRRPAIEAEQGIGRILVAAGDRRDIGEAEEIAALLEVDVLQVGFRLELAAYPYDVDQGEGYDVNSGWLIAQGRPIYTDNNLYPYYSSNYPPLYSLALGLIVQETGPTLAAGRLLRAR